MPQIKKINGLTIPNSVYLTGFTYDGVNTFTINDSSGNTFNATINVLSATTLSATTFYGDGSNLTGIVSTDNYVTGGTLDGNSIVLGRTDEAAILVLSGTSNITITEPISGTFLVDSVGGSGEVNTASNVGSGVGIFSGKTGVDLKFKTLTSTGNTVTITSDDTTVNLESSGTSGGVNDDTKIFSWFMNIT